MQEVCIIRGQSMPAIPSTKGNVALRTRYNPVRPLVAVPLHPGVLGAVKAVKAVKAVHHLFRLHGVVYTTQH